MKYNAHNNFDQVRNVNICSCCSSTCVHNAFLLRQRYKNYKKNSCHSVQSNSIIKSMSLQSNSEKPACTSLIKSVLTIYKLQLQ